MSWGMPQVPRLTMRVKLISPAQPHTPGRVHQAGIDRVQPVDQRGHAAHLLQRHEGEQGQRRDHHDGLDIEVQTTAR